MYYRGRTLRSRDQQHLTEGKGGEGVNGMYEKGKREIQGWCWRGVKGVLMIYVSVRGDVLSRKNTSLEGSTSPNSGRLRVGGVKAEYEWDVERM